MRIIFKLLFFLLISSGFISCNPRKVQEENADKMLKEIQLLIDRESYNAAKLKIDSIHSLFPMLVEKRRIAAALEDTVVRRESSRSLIYCDSILPKKINAMDSIQKNFRFEKNKKYQEIGNFVYKTEQTESNANRTYLKTYVDENADFYLVSNYCGGKIEQQSIEVSSGDLFAHTDTISISDPNNHRFDDGGSHFESLIFKNESQNGVVEFIAQSTFKTIKITLHGKKSYVYYLVDADRKAIVETYHLWKEKKDVVLLQREIKKAISRIERINKSKKITIKSGK
jgi:hypothetical protein